MIDYEKFIKNDSGEVIVGWEVVWIWVFVKGGEGLDMRVIEEGKVGG